MPAGKILILIGLLLVIAGLIITFGPKIPFLGKLPGDFHYKRDGFSFYFPLASCLLVSLLLSLLFWLLKK